MSEEPALAAWLDPLSLPPRRRDRARRALQAANRTAAPDLPVEAPPHPGGATTWRYLRPAATLALTTAAGRLLLGASWYVLALGTVAPTAQRGWYLAWALLLLTAAVLQAGERAAAHRLSRQIAPHLQRRRVARRLDRPPERLPHDAASRGAAAILATEAFEDAAWIAGPAALAAAVELAAAGWLLARPAAAPLAAALLAGAAAAATALLATQHLRAAAAAFQHRLASTGRIAEALAGHRTRLTQGWGPPDARDDEAAAEIHRAHRTLDTWETRLRIALPEACWLAGLAALLLAILHGATAPGRLAAALAGLSLSRAGLSQLSAAFSQLGAGWGDAKAARSALEETASADGRMAADTPVHLAPAPPGPSPAPRLVEARDLTIRAAGGRQPLLSGAHLEIWPGERLVLSGPSGAGKSTLAAVLAAQRRPDSGLLLLSGLDLATWGPDPWRRKVVAVPQSHENHLFADTLAFNLLLLGRGWPPPPGSHAEAAALCEELGLGTLLARCPAGLEQRIGEGGWQLSDGEASRVYVARALLQHPDLLILDESLAALDPATRIRVLDVVARRAGALLVITHGSVASQDTPASR